MKEIQLSRGKVALVDDEDYGLVMGYAPWIGHLRANNVWYAFRMKRKWMPDGDWASKTCIYMHRLIASHAFGVLGEKHVDHKDGDGLNNVRSNLRLCERTQNMFNARTRAKPSGLPKGVNKNGRRYRATIRIHGRVIHLGYFDTPEEAHCAYMVAAGKLAGEFACNGVR